MAASSSDAIELPPDVTSSAEEDAGRHESESPVELPETEENLCCKKNCLADLPPSLKETAEKMKHDLEALDLSGKNTIWFNLLLNMNRQHPEGQFRRKFYWHEKVVCLKAFSWCTGCLPPKIREFLRLIAQGECVAPVDGRSCAKKRVEPKREDVESFFVFMYYNLAEPLANVHKEADEEFTLDSSDLVEMPEWAAENDAMLQGPAFFPSSGKPKVQKRWLPTMTTAEIFDLYQEMHASHAELASLATFKRAWTKWQSVLGVRAATVHSRCDDCAKYSLPAADHLFEIFKVFRINGFLNIKSYFNIYFSSYNPT